MKTNYPKDDENTIYLPSIEEFSLGAILEIAKQKWPAADLNDIKIESEYRHVECLGYDLYDSQDYQNYIVITKI